MNYMVCTRGKRGPVFATLEEASAYEMKYRRKTGNFVAIIMTARKITHRKKVSVILEESCIKELEKTANALHNSYLETVSYILENMTEDTMEADKETIAEQQKLAEVWKKIAEACMNKKEV